MSAGSIILSVLSYLWDLTYTWLYTLVISFTSLETVWIIVPIWLSWFFVEFFQEKHGTSFGNAISNGVIPFWVGIDWVRQITAQLISAQITFGMLTLGKYFLSALIMAYGLTIIILGIKKKEIIKYLGRIREVTYVLIVFTPFIYGKIEPSFIYFLSVLLFFPIFYGIIELIDRLTPEPVALKEDEEEKKSSENSDQFSFDTLK